MLRSLPPLASGTPVDTRYHCQRTKTTVRFLSIAMARWLTVECQPSALEAVCASLQLEERPPPEMTPEEKAALEAQEEEEKSAKGKKAKKGKDKRTCGVGLSREAGAHALCVAAKKGKKGKGAEDEGPPAPPPFGHAVLGYRRSSWLTPTAALRLKVSLKGQQPQPLLLKARTHCHWCFLDLTCQADRSAAAASAQ